MTVPRYPNRYNAPDEEIEEDQHVRAWTKANQETDDESNSQEARDCYREQADAEREHIEEIRRRRDE